MSAFSPSRKSRTALSANALVSTSSAICRPVGFWLTRKYLTSCLIFAHLEVFGLQAHDRLIVLVEHADDHLPLDRLRR